MTTFKNVSGVDLDVRLLGQGHDGKSVKADDIFEVKEELVDETDDAFITSRTARNKVGRGEDGLPVWVDEEVQRAWPKAHWAKVEKEAKVAAKADAKEGK